MADRCQSGASGNSDAAKDALPFLLDPRSHPERVEGRKDDIARVSLKLSRLIYAG